MSEVSSTLVNQTIALVIPPTVPVNVGEARFAFKARSVLSASVPFLSCSVYVLLAVFVLVKKLVNVFAKLRSPRVRSRKVLTHVFVCALAKVISHVPAATFSVVPVYESPVPRVISSITHVPVVALPRSLFVVMLSSFLVARRLARFVLRLLLIICLKIKNG